MKRVHVDDAESHIVRQKRYNTQVYDFVDSLDLGAIVRFNVLSCVKKALLDSWNQRVKYGGMFTLPTDMGSVMFRADENDSAVFNVSQFSLQTPPILLPPALRKRAEMHGGSPLEIEQSFMPTIVRISFQSAKNPNEIEVPEVLNTLNCEKLKNGVF